MAASGRPLQFTELNWILLGTAVLVIALGYIMLGSGSPFLSTVAAPIILVAGYVVLIPLGLIL